ncbi:MAG: hypothetical protein ACK4VW_00475 [Anaerolineales bacterium]
MTEHKTPDPTLSDFERLLLHGLESPEATPTPALKVGDQCPQCGQGKLEYNGTLDLECPHCGYVVGGGGGCT